MSKKRIFTLLAATVFLTAALIPGRALAERYAQRATDATSSDVSTVSTTVDRAADNNLERPVVAPSGGYSGDDAYDPAAGGNPDASISAATGDLSGDDAYDSAVGGNLGPSISVVTGGYSGDDAYDPAAGGTPELYLPSAAAVP